MNDALEGINRESGIEKNEWMTVSSELESLDGSKKEIKIELMEGKKPRAMAFFDIDGTLAHLDIIHGRAIAKLFPNEEKKELEETYYKGFRLGNSFREFDRMIEVYNYGHIEWKDPEVYIKERLNSHKEEIDEPGNDAHDRAAEMLKKYGEVAGETADEIFKNNPEEFKKTNIEPIFKLAKMYGRLGIPMVGFTANAKVFVEKLAKYLGLSDIFIDIATDETMSGGGKEIAIHHLIKMAEEKGIPVPKSNLIFVGDSIRGDIGTSILANKKDNEIHGQGILILKNKEELIKIKKQINEDPELYKLVNSMEINAFMTDNAIDSNGEVTLASYNRDKFLERL